VGVHVSLRACGKAVGRERMKITDCQPDSGNPTVREERGAYGNVSDGGTRNPLHTPKGCRTETLCLRLRAPYFYPTSGACIHRGNSGTWESPRSPWHMPGMGDRVIKSPGVVWGFRPAHEPTWDITNAPKQTRYQGASGKRSARRGAEGSLSEA
jgi:hypothetical protein